MSTSQDCSMRTPWTCSQQGAAFGVQLLRLVGELVDELFGLSVRGLVGGSVGAHIDQLDGALGVALIDVLIGAPVGRWKGRVVGGFAVRLVG